MDYLIVIILVSFSGLFSGLTLALLSLDVATLKRKVSLGDKQAQKVYEVRKKGNLLLCTLLLGNVGVNSALAIFLGDIASGIIAGMVATGLIVIFGEILPQAIFSRYAIYFGARTAWLVKIFIFIFYPFCWPIAKSLDIVLGEEMNTVYSKHELMKIIEEHEGSTESDIDADEERIVKGALSFSSLTAADIMTPRSKIFVLEVNQILDKKLLNKIKREGFARIPVYQGQTDNVVGILYIKDLINIKPNLKIASVYHKKKAFVITQRTKLDTLLNAFINRQTHLALVKNKAQRIEGVVTLEDVLEEIINQEIIDETDTTTDLPALIK